MMEDEESLSVRVLIQPENFPYHVSVNSKSTLIDLKLKVAETLGVSDKAILLYPIKGVNEEGPLEELVTRVACGSDRIREVRIVLKPPGTASTEQSSRESSSKASFFQTPQVVIYRDLKQTRDFEGGFQSKHSGKVYLSCGNQCSLRKTKLVWEQESQRKMGKLKERKCQTGPVTSHSSQTKEEKGTQTYLYRKDLFTDSSLSTFLTFNNKSFVSGEDLCKMKLRSAIQIQSFWRKVMANRQVRKLFLHSLGRERVTEAEIKSTSCDHFPKDIFQREEQFLKSEATNSVWRLSTGDTIEVETSHVTLVRKMLRLLENFQFFSKLQHLENDLPIEFNVSAESWWKLLDEIELQLEEVSSPHKLPIKLRKDILQLLKREYELGRRRRCRSWKSRETLRKRLEFLLKDACVQVASSGPNPIPQTKS
eukprot:snap_masked-scaffold_2-processed-gene-15.8-mRNA-1 protein AED:1.00 eAED:1.00 QI:0/0/0/0/1/1/2/0/422